MYEKNLIAVPYPFSPPIVSFFLARVITATNWLLHENTQFFLLGAAAGVIVVGPTAP